MYCDKSLLSCSLVRPLLFCVLFIVWAHALFLLVRLITFIFICLWLGQFQTNVRQLSLQNNNKIHTHTHFNRRNSCKYSLSADWFFSAVCFFPLTIFLSTTLIFFSSLCFYFDFLPDIFPIGCISLRIFS